MNNFHKNTRTALFAVLVFASSVTWSQSKQYDSTIEISAFMKLDTILFLENHIFQDIPHSLCIGSANQEMLVFNYFPISKIDTFELTLINKRTYSIIAQKIPIPKNEYVHLKQHNHCSALVFNDSCIVLGFYNKFIVLQRNEKGSITYSHSIGHTLGYFNDLKFVQDTLFAAKCSYSSSSKTTLLCSFVVSTGIMTEAGSWEHPYMEFAHFDMNKKWICFSDKHLIVSNALDDTILVLLQNNEIARFSLNLNFNNPDYNLDSLRTIISPNEPRRWINALSDAYYFRSSLINYIELVDKQYLLIRYIRPGESFNNRTYYACAKLKPDCSGIETFLFKDIEELRVPKDVNQFISKENFDFFTASALMDIHNNHGVLVKAEGKTPKYNTTRANLFSINQAYLKQHDPLICLYFYRFSYH